MERACGRAGRCGCAALRTWPHRHVCEYTTPLWLMRQRGRARDRGARGPRVASEGRSATAPLPLESRGLRQASKRSLSGASARRDRELGSGKARTGTQEAWHLLHRVIASAWPSASPPAPPLASLAPVRWWRAVRRGRNCAVCRNRGASLHVHSSGLQPLVLETLRSCGAARRLEFEKRLQESRDRVGVLASEVVFLV